MSNTWIEENGIKYYKRKSVNEYIIMGTIDNFSKEIIEIPEFVDGIPVTQIADGAFRNNQHVKELNLPGSINIIGDVAFTNCSNLKIVGIYGRNKTINLHNGVFSNCKSLETVMSYQNINLLGNEVFSNCTSLKWLLVKFINEIPRKTFENCISLDSIDFYKDVVVDDSAFDGCLNLTKMEIRAVVKFSEQFTKTFLKDIKILCFDNSQFVDLAYEGYNINIIKMF